MRYWAKLPRHTFAQRRPTKTIKTRFFRSAEKCRIWIEEQYAPGYTTEPYVQLVQETATEMRVLCEYMPGQGWVGALEAAGFIPHPAY